MSVLKDISVYLRLVLVLLGLVGNTLTICLMFRKKFKTSIGLYMLILAVADLGVMIFGQGYFLLDTNKFINHTDALCKVRTLVMYMSYHLSSLTLACMSFERALVLVVPHRSKQLCTRKRAYIVAACLFVTALAIDGPLVHSAAAGVKPNGTPYCAMKGLSTYIKYIHPIFHLILANFGPYAIILGANSVIIFILVRRATKQGSLTNVKQDYKDNSMTRMTILLLTVSFTYILLTVPHGAYILGRPYWYKDNPAYGRSHENPALVAVTLCSCANHAINFFLYVLSGATFREELVAMLKCKSEAQLRRERSMMTMTTSVRMKEPSGTVGSDMSMKQCETTALP